VLLDGNALSLPRAEIQRIVVFGDTGCRIKEEDSKLPGSKRVALHQSGNACRANSAGFSDSRWRLSLSGILWSIGVRGYPNRLRMGRVECGLLHTLSPLFAAAPWVMVRGNHKNCSRAAEGWFRFLDRATEDPSCSEMGPPYVVDLGRAWALL